MSEPLPGSATIREYVSGVSETPGPLPSDFAQAIARRKAAMQEQRGGTAPKRPRPGASTFGFKQAYQVHDTLARLPAPGGIGLLVIILVVLLLVLIPITSDKETRLSLLFGVLGGKKQIGPPPVNTGIPGGPNIPGLPQNPYGPGNPRPPNSGSGAPLAIHAVTSLVPMDLPPLIGGLL